MRKYLLGPDLLRRIRSWLSRPPKSHPQPQRQPIAEYIPSSATSAFFEVKSGVSAGCGGPGSPFLGDEVLVEAPECVSFTEYEGGIKGANIFDAGAIATWIEVNGEPMPAGTVVRAERMLVAGSAEPLWIAKQVIYCPCGGCNKNDMPSTDPLTEPAWVITNERLINLDNTGNLPLEWELQEKSDGDDRGTWYFFGSTYSSGDGDPMDWHNQCNWYSSVEGKDPLDLASTLGQSPSSYRSYLKARANRLPDKNSIVYILSPVNTERGGPVSVGSMICFYSTGGYLDRNACRALTADIETKIPLEFTKTMPSAIDSGYSAFFYPNSWDGRSANLGVIRGDVMFFMAQNGNKDCAGYNIDTREGHVVVHGNCYFRQPGYWQNIRTPRPENWGTIKGDVVSYAEAGRYAQRRRFLNYGVIEGNMNSWGSCGLLQQVVCNIECHAVSSGRVDGDLVIRSAQSATIYTQNSTISGIIRGKLECYGGLTEVYAAKQFASMPVTSVGGGVYSEAKKLHVSMAIEGGITTDVPKLDGNDLYDTSVTVYHDDERFIAGDINLNGSYVRFSATSSDPSNSRELGKIDVKSGYGGWADFRSYSYADEDPVITYMDSLSASGYISVRFYGDFFSRNGITIKGSSSFSPGSPRNVDKFTPVLTLLESSTCLRVAGRVLADTVEARDNSVVQGRVPDSTICKFYDNAKTTQYFIYGFWWNLERKCFYSPYVTSPYHGGPLPECLGEAAGCDTSKGDFYTTGGCGGEL